MTHTGQLRSSFEKLQHTVQESEQSIWVVVALKNHKSFRYLFSYYLRESFDLQILSSFFYKSLTVFLPFLNTISSIFIYYIYYPNI